MEGRACLEEVDFLGKGVSWKQYLLVLSCYCCYCSALLPGHLDVSCSIILSPPRWTETAETKNNKINLFSI
jgi:hypothetical protein